MKIASHSLLFLLLCYQIASASADINVDTVTVLHDEPLVNQHPGYRSAWAVNGELDKVLLVVPGFDTSNDSMPIDELYNDLGSVTEFLGELGWDVIYFDYVDGAIDLKMNAENLAHFIRHLNSRVGQDYYLSVVGGSMGGIVARTMFVQERASLGVDTYVSIDSPHRGVHLSEWAEDLAVLAVDHTAAHQMHKGDPLYNAHYGWLRRIESTDFFQRTVNEPMNTCAIALSDGSQGAWKVSWETRFLHNKFQPVSSYLEVSGLRSTYMPYHSAVYLDSDATSRRYGWGQMYYRYRDLSSGYFDEIIANPVDEHGAPEYAIIQAMDFAIANGPR